MSIGTTGAPEVFALPYKAKNVQMEGMSVTFLPLALQY